MGKNDQISFPLEPKTYVDPYDKEYRERLQRLNMGEPTTPLPQIEQELRDAADLLSSMFSWDETLEGYMFWGHASDALSAMADEIARRQGRDPREALVMDGWGPPRRYREPPQLPDEI